MRTESIAFQLVIFQYLKKHSTRIVYWPHYGIIIESSKFLSKCPCSWFGLLGLFFTASCPNETHYFYWDFLHARLNSHCKTWSCKKRKHKKIKAYRRSYKKRRTVNRCLLILDLNPYLKARTTESSDGFLHLRETSLDTIWEVEHFRLFFVFLVAGLVDLSWESSNFSNAPNTEKEM